MKGMSNIYLIQELDIAISTIESGFSILRKAKPLKTNYFLLFLVFSTGLERILKVLLCLHYYSQNEKYPTEKIMKGYGHNIHELHKSVIDLSYTDESMKKEIIKDDFTFMSTNLLLQKFILSHSEFATKNRYAYLNGVSLGQSTISWFSSVWEEIENIAIPIKEALPYIENNQLEQYCVIVNNLIIVCIEKYMRALARTVTLTHLSKDAQSLAGRFFDYLFLSDEELGKKQYEIHNPII